jgi:hypothetical protein
LPLYRGAEEFRNASTARAMTADFDAVIAATHPISAGVGGVAGCSGAAGSETDIVWPDPVVGIISVWCRNRLGIDVVTSIWPS